MEFTRGDINLGITNGLKLGKQEPGPTAPTDCSECQFWDKLFHVEWRRMWGYSCSGL